MKLIA
jgi:hypothetical protein